MYLWTLIDLALFTGSVFLWYYFSHEKKESFLDFSKSRFHSILSHHRVKQCTEWAENKLLTFIGGNASPKTLKLLEMIDDLEKKALNKKCQSKIGILRKYAKYEPIPFEYRLRVFFIYAFYSFIVRKNSFYLYQLVIGGFIRDSVSGFFNFEDLSKVNDIDFHVCGAIFNCILRNENKSHAFYRFMYNHGFTFKILHGNRHLIKSVSNFKMDGEEPISFEFDIVKNSECSKSSIDFDVNNLMASMDYCVYFLKYIARIHCLRKTLPFISSYIIDYLVNEFSKRCLNPRCIRKLKKGSYSDKYFICNFYNYYSLMMEEKEDGNDEKEDSLCSYRVNVISQCVEAIRRKEMTSFIQAKGIFEGCVNDLINSENICGLMNIYFKRSQKMFSKGYRIADDNGDTFLPKLYDNGECMSCLETNVDYDGEQPKFVKMSCCSLNSPQNSGHFMCVSCYVKMIKDKYRNYDNYDDYNDYPEKISLTSMPTIRCPFCRNNQCCFTTVQQDEEFQRMCETKADEPDINIDTSCKTGSDNDKLISEFTKSIRETIYNTPMNGEYF